MRQIRIGEELAELDQEGKWYASDQHLAIILNRHSAEFASSLSPADGDVQKLMFQEVVESFNAEVLVDDVRIMDPDRKGTVY